MLTLLESSKSIFVVSVITSCCSSFDSSSLVDSVRSSLVFLNFLLILGITDGLCSICPCLGDSTELVILISLILSLSFVVLTVGLTSFSPSGVSFSFFTSDTLSSFFASNIFSSFRLELFFLTHLHQIPKFQM